MLDNEPTGGATAPDNTTTEDKPAPKRRTRRASRPAGAPDAAEATQAAGADAAPSEPAASDTAGKTTRARRTRKKAAAPVAAGTEAPVAGSEPAPAAGSEPAQAAASPAFQPPSLVFQEPAPSAGSATQGRKGRTAKAAPAEPAEEVPAEPASDGESDDRRRRRRRSPAKDKRAEAADAPAAAEPEPEPEEAASDDGEASGTTSRRRRRRRRRAGAPEVVEESAPDDPERTVVKVREPREQEAEAVKGSTRLEAKKQRRRESRESGRRRAPIISEAEFLARRESVERVMVVRQIDSRIQIAVLEDGVLVEHYVSREAQNSYVGNVYLGKVQNVLPSMEAAFIDIGRGRNAVLYAGEVNFDLVGLEGQPKRIENALKSGQSVLAQVTKDPIAHKGARLTSQISLPGRFLVYVPEGSMTGISRKLPETERGRLKSVLRSIIPEDAGFIVRTAAEGASEEELERDVNRLVAQWEDIQQKAKTASAPALLYGEPDLTIRVIRDIFNEDFSKLVVSGEDIWETVEPYVAHVAPDLASRVSRWTEPDDVFAAHRIDEQLVKALDRKVWLPSGGSLVIDRTEAMTVVDVNTGKFTGQGGNLEETVTKNNLEAAEEIVRQLRLRDIGGIIVVDFIDMVLESNRELVSRRLLECLGRDRTKHQVAEVTSLGLVQMTRKRVGQGLLEAFSEVCDCCNGRGIKIHSELLEARSNGGRRPARSVAAVRDGAGAGEPAAPAALAAPAEPALPAAPAESALPAATGNGSDSGASAPARSRRRRRATRPQGSPSAPEGEPAGDGAGAPADEPGLPNGATRPSGVGSPPGEPASTSHPDAQPVPLGWPI